MNTERSLEYVYVIFGQISNKRMPFGVFHTRTAAESAIEEGTLEKSLNRYDLRMSDCDHYTIERWEVGRFLEDSYVKTMTSYDRYGNMMKRFEEDLEEDEDAS